MSFKKLSKICIRCNKQFFCTGLMYLNCSKNKSCMCALCLQKILVKSKYITSLTLTIEQTKDNENIVNIITSMNQWDKNQVLIRKCWLISEQEKESYVLELL
jgi:hypothetical protein